MRVFLTGGTGFIGRPLARRMVERGWEVTALVRNPNGIPARSLVELGIGLAQGDVTERESMRAAMQDAEVVIHNAAWYELGVNAAARAAMQRINVDGTENVLGLAHELGIPRTVHVSSVVSYAPTGKTPRDESHPRHGPYPSFYAQTKAAAHEIAAGYQARGLPLIIASPGVVIGPNDHAINGYFARLYINGWMPPMAWGKDSIFVQATAEDTAEAIVLAAEKGQIGESYLICGDPIRIGEMAAIWAASPGRFRIRFWLPPAVMRWSCAPLIPLLRALGISAFLDAEAIATGAQDLSFTNAKARRELGWNPQSPHEAWVEIMDAERVLAKERRSGSIAARLNPLDI